MKATAIRPKTVSLIGKLIGPWVDEGIITVAESREILSNLRYLSKRGALLPVMQPKLLNQEQAADMLGISRSNLKKMEAEGKLPIKRKCVGTSVRYVNTDIIEFMLSEEEEDAQ